MRVHVFVGIAGCSDTARPGALTSAGMNADATSTRSQGVTVGNRNGVPPFGTVTFTSPTKNCVCVQELRKAPSRAARPVLSPPP